MKKSISDEINAAINMIEMECQDDEGWIRNLVEGSWLGNARHKIEQLGNQAVAPLIERLADGNRRTTIFIADLFAQLKDPTTVEPLIKILLNQSNRDDVRQAAANALAEIGDRRAVAALLAVVAERDAQNYPRYVSGKAAIALGKIGDKAALEPLAAIVADQSITEWLRRDVAKALGEFSTKRARQSLISALSDPAEQLRAAAAQALAQTKNRLAVEPLRTALKDSYAMVRREAVIGLFKNDPDNAVDTILAVIESERDSYVGQTMIIYLGRAGDRRANATLIKLLASRNSELQVEAVKALGQLKAVEAIEALGQLLLNSSSSHTRWNIVETLGLIKDHAATTILIKALNDKDDFVRYMAAKALGRLRDPAAIDALVDCLKDRDRYSKNPTLAAREAGDALIKIGKAALLPLKSALNSDDAQLSASALETIKRIEKKQKRRKKN